MSRLCVIVRVHDRLRDLEECLRIIRRYWKLELYLLVVSNGSARGFKVPESVRQTADQVLELDHNAGHILGNAQLLQAAVAHIPVDCDYSVLIEADTWLFSDQLIRRYLDLLAARAAVWASAGWQDRYYSVALDFAIVKSSLLSDFPGILHYHRSAECHVANLLRQHDLRWLQIRELMPVHIPSLLRRFWNHYGGRFRVFPQGPMVTHHIEDLAGGFEQKLQEANICLGRTEYPQVEELNWPRLRRQIIRLRRLAQWIPRSGHPGPRRSRRIPPLDSNES